MLFSVKKGKGCIMNGINGDYFLNMKYSPRLIASFPHVSPGGYHLLNMMYVMHQDLSRFLQKSNIQMIYLIHANLTVL